jgi:hypothetical protein
MVHFKFLFFALRSIALSLFILATTSCYSQLSLAAPGEVEEAIKIHMMPFYGYEGDWHLVFKEIGDSTIVAHANATLSIYRDSVKFKRDSAELHFDIHWESKAIKKFVDMASLKISYSWDSEKYIMSIMHLPNDGVISGSAAWPTMDFQKRELFYESKSASRNRLTMTHWKLFDDKIVFELKIRSANSNHIRHQFFTFERVKKQD